MDDLMKCLYEFVLEQRMGSLHEDPEYREISYAAEIQDSRTREGLSEEQQKELNQLIDKITTQDSIFNQHLFCAALGLARELNALGRT